MMPLKRWTQFAWAILAAAPAVAQPPIPAPSPTQWSMDWQAPYCMISTGDVKDVGLSVWSVPGSRVAEVYIIGARERVPQIAQGVKASLKLAGGELISVPVFYPGLEWAGVLKLQIVDDHVLAKLDSVTEIKIQDSGKQLSVPVRGAKAAMRALQGCVDAKLPAWGIDPANFRALKQLPKAVKSGPLLTPDDYPSQALELGQGGTAVFRLTVDASGKLTGCTLVQSSGSAAIDRVTCANARKRAKFTPAVGADGLPTAASFISYSSFKIWGRHG